MDLLGSLGSVIGGRTKKPSVGSGTTPKQYKDLNATEKRRVFEKAKNKKMGSTALKREVITGGNWDHIDKAELIKRAKDMGTRQESIQKITKDVTKNKSRTYKQRFMDRIAKSHYEEDPQFAKSKPQSGFTVFSKKSPEKEVDPSQMQRTAKPKIGLIKNKRTGRLDTRATTRATSSRDTGKGSITTLGPVGSGQKAIGSGKEHQVGALETPEGGAGSVKQGEKVVGIGARAKKPEAENDKPANDLDFPQQFDKAA